jgi:hypothetical protein
VFADCVDGKMGGNDLSCQGSGSGGIEKVKNGLDLAKAFAEKMTL